MDFAHQQRNPAKHLLGISFVIVFHLLLVYALISGLARKVVEVIQKPLETKIIEEVKPPPPPETPPPPPPKMDVPPPPSFIPPPEVQVTPPPTPPQNAITATTSVKPETTQIAPVAPTAPAATPAPSAPAAPPAPPTARGLCSNAQDIASASRAKFEKLAAEEGIAEGSTIEIRVEFVIGPGGEIKSPKIVRSTNPALNSLALTVVKRFGCRGQAADVTVPYDLVFKLTE